MKSGVHVRPESLFNFAGIRIVRIRKKIEYYIALEVEGIRLNFRRGKEEGNYVIAMNAIFTENYPKTRGKLELSETSVDLSIFKDIYSEDEGSAGAAM
ncbi:hypothetical protein [Sedimenticola hydrogenitrophicus]|uniref:hypothetical protein n=1 Tax=Sedimenticola hydrogenitrophicus TaxID=2967975 RepID=UPI0021A7C9C5|nr:hypothetical protein [Sedimenticola hydrogenitrophicus]